MDEWVTVARAATRLEAEMWKEALESAGIPVQLVAKGLSDLGSILFGSHVAVPGGVQLRVPAPAADAAAKLVEELIPAPEEESEGELEGEPGEEPREG